MKRTVEKDGWVCIEIFKNKEYKSFGGFLRAVKQALRDIGYDDDLTAREKIYRFNPDYAGRQGDEISGYYVTVGYSAYKELEKAREEMGRNELTYEEVLRLTGELSSASWDFESGWKAGYSFDFDKGLIYAYTCERKGNKSALGGKK